MASYAISINPFLLCSTCSPTSYSARLRCFHFEVTSSSQRYRALPVSAVPNAGRKVEKSRFKWVEVKPDTMTEEQKQAISKLSPELTDRCKALMRQIICCTYEEWKLSDLLDAWSRIMKPTRIDWLWILRELKLMEHPAYVEVLELALPQESFQANIRDYTKLIHCYGKQNRLQDAESVLLTVERKGFVCDQVTLTTMIHMYSKAGNHKLAEETFEDLKLLGEPVDRRSYGSMIMAYIRAGMLDKGEALFEEMRAQDIQAGSEVYKAMLRAYAMIGDAEGAQRVFNTIQCAGICPDVRICGLLIKAYQMAGKNQKARIAFDNMRAAGIEPNDKCLADILSTYVKENKLDSALDFLLSLEKQGIVIGQEASHILAEWFRRLGVAKEVEQVLRDHAAREADCKTPAS